MPVFASFGQEKLCKDFTLAPCLLLGVCAMFLKAKLDLSEILIQRHFSIQNLQALRAKKLKKISKLKEPFYKIHPVLKNIAILKLCAS